ncbi:MAG: hypothetical protein M3186_18175 [Actinomycetota bacterium]|nr:hypothetical protein [Actinomycetota bacterium]
MDAAPTHFTRTHLTLENAMDETTWPQTAETVRAAYADGDVAGLAPLLAPDVRWHGAGPGGCHSAVEVLAWITDRAGKGVSFRLHGLRRMARACCYTSGWSPAARTSTRPEPGRRRPHHPAA